MGMFCKSMEGKLHLPTCCYPVCARTEVNPGIQRCARFSSSYLATCLFANFAGKFKLHIDGGGGTKDISWFRQSFFSLELEFSFAISFLWSISIAFYYTNELINVPWTYAMWILTKLIICCSMFSKILQFQQWNYWCCIWLPYKNPTKEETKQKNKPKWVVMGSLYFVPLLMRC